MEPPGHLSDALSVVITLLLLPVFGLIEYQTSCFRPKRLGHNYASRSILDLNAMPALRSCKCTKCQATVHTVQ